MPLSTETIPNRPLNGAELLEVACLKFREAMQRDCMFTSTIAYGRVAFTITATFHVSNSAVQPFTVRTRVPKEGVVEGDVPLKPPNLDATFVSLETKVKVDNPNLERVHAGLPIKVQGRRGTGPTTPNDPFPQIETKEYRYDQEQYPKPEEPVVVDVSEREASAHPIHYKKRNQPKPKPKPNDHPANKFYGEYIPADALDPEEDPMPGVDEE